MVEKKDNQLKQVERALSAALVPVAPPRELYTRLQGRIRGLAPQRAEPLTRAARRNMAFIGLAGVFTVLITLAVGVRTAGSIVGAIAVVNEMNRQLKTRKSGSLTPSV